MSRTVAAAVSSVLLSNSAQDGRRSFLIRPRATSSSSTSITLSAANFNNAIPRFITIIEVNLPIRLEIIRINKQEIQHVGKSYPMTSSILGLISFLLELAFSRGTNIPVLHEATNSRASPGWFYISPVISAL